MTSKKTYKLFINNKVLEINKKDIFNFFYDKKKVDNFEEEGNMLDLIFSNKDRETLKKIEEQYNTLKKKKSIFSKQRLEKEKNISPKKL